MCLDIRVLEKCSFTFEGRLRKRARDKSDTLCYSILRENCESYLKPRQFGYDYTNFAIPLTK